ncbi:unnamed protein product [Echinostoma caproni]|uniref:FERM domain-containing protein n=1 Tax=Echinostoma caproni TaxID=27848 RepID=A0A183AXI0_9TREM|nr:unnamed protein product [Echinostoma caproni]
MSGIENNDDDDENGDVWCLRQPVTPRTPSSGRLEPPTEVDTNRQNGVPQNELLGAQDARVDSRPHGEGSSATRSFSVLASFRDTLSSVFHSPTVTSNSDPSLACRVILLDGRVLPFGLKPNAVGRDLFSKVTSYLALEQDDFFGLTYSLADNRLTEPDKDRTTGVINGTANSPGTSAPGDSQAPWSTSVRPLSTTLLDSVPDPTSISRSSRRRHTRTMSQSLRFGELWKRNHTYMDDVLFWLDLEKRISEQCKGPSYVFHFQVKYYLSHPDRDIYCSEARRQYCLQLRQHLLTGRLPCSFNTHILLGAYISQFVLGDAHPRHSGLNDSTGASIRSSFSSRRGSRALSLSEGQSLGSERACSLAEPELSDVDWDVANENADGGKSGEIAWIPQLPSSPIGDDTVRLIRCKCATLANPGWEGARPSIDCSRSVRSESAHSTYLSVLPHLNRLSRSSSRGRPRVGISDGDDDVDANGDVNGAGFDPSAAPDNWFTAHQLSPVDWTESPGANWPYPNPTGYYCPEMLKRIARLHRRIRGTPRSRAERRFLRESKKLSMYGVELHLVKV